MLSCKDTARLISKNLDETLPFYEKAGVLIHLFICKPCNSYYKQLKELRTMANLYIKRSKNISPEAKERIKKKLNRLLRN